MAEWKKIVVSGSAISQLNNDSNYLVAGDSVSSLSGSFSGSFEGDGSGITGITADTLGNSIVDGNGIADFTFNGSAGATVSVEADGSTLSVGSGGVKVADAGITATQLNASVAGDGLAGGAGTALSVTVDDSTIEINSDSLRVKSTFSSSLDSRISANATNISSNDTDIANLTAATSSYATAASQTTLSSSLAGRIANQEAFSSSLDTTFASDAELTALSQSLAARDAVNEGDIDTLQAVQGALVAATSSYAASNTVTSISESLAASITTNASDIDDLEAVQGALVAATASYASATSVTNASSSLAASITTNATAISGNDTDISALQGVQGALVAATSSYAVSSSVATAISDLDSNKQDNISVSDTSGQGGIDLTFSSDTLSGTVVGLGQSDSPTFAGLSVTGNTTIGGNLTVNGTASYVNTQDLFVEDRFILLNSGSANPDEGGIVIDEGGDEGHAYFYDSNNVRFGFTSSLDATTTGGATPDAFAAAVVDEAAGHSDVAEYQKNGNIRVTSGGDIFIYA